ncbi:hypothetical protein Hamer_G005983 [Homarus americanus]|uniref:Uncharacterized protein n=1 Tax=Homarus americanus TaxID=6706 RepID=A0A8J5MLV0_HOMAM|nr:hypothetical protein Hamer_G005983 [Homarus americanus]
MRHTTSTARQCHFQAIPVDKVLLTCLYGALDQHEPYWVLQRLQHSYITCPPGLVSKIPPLSPRTAMLKPFHSNWLIMPGILQLGYHCLEFVAAGLPWPDFFRVAYHGLGYLTDLVTCPVSPPPGTSTLHSPPHGHSRDRPQTLPRHAEDTLKTCMKHARDTYGTRIRHVLDMPGIRMGHAWSIKETP